MGRTCIQQRSGMCGGVDLLQGPQSDVRIDLRGLDVFVAEDLLDEADVGAVLVHVRRHAVPQQMTGPGLGGWPTHQFAAP